MSPRIESTTGTFAYVRGGKRINSMVVNSSGVAALVDTYSLQTDGVDEHVDFGNNFAFERTDKFTIEIWFNRLGNGGVSLAPLFSKRNAGQTTGFVFIARTSLNAWVVQFLHNDTNNFIDVRGAFTWLANTWYQVVLVSDGTSNAAGIHVYVNSVELAKTVLNDSLTLSMVNTDPFCIGKDGSASLFTAGASDWLRVWNTNLSAAEVATIYGAGHPIQGVLVPSIADILGFYPLGIAPEWTDSSTVINPNIGAVLGSGLNLSASNFITNVP